MPQIINTNVSSLNAQRNLNRSQGDLALALQRVSSGLRINSAKDDAAGLAISDRQTAQIRGMNQAVRNAADAISLAQTGEGGLQEITNALQRMRELAVQSRNVTNTDADRASLDGEFQQLLAEIDRISTTTAFNGNKVLDGSLGSSVFQVGANVGETISVDVSTSARTNSIGSYATVNYSLVNVADQTAATAGALTGDTLDFATSGHLQINGVNIGAAADTSAGRGDGSALSIANAINALSSTTNVDATASASTTTFTSTQIANGLNFTDNVGTNDTLQYTVSINGTQVVVQTEGATALSAEGLANAVNNQQSNTGVTATVSSAGDLTLTAADGRNIEITEELTGFSDAANDTVVGYFGNTLTGAVAAEFNAFKGAVTLSGNVAQISVISATTANTDVIQGVDDDGAASVTTASTLDAANVLTTNASDEAILRIDQSINDIDNFRGTFGAVQSRFESTIANLEINSENTSAARSRIRDADFATETAALTRAQILQQAGVAVLAQANALPQNVLALLQ